MKPKLTTRLTRTARRGCHLARSIILAVATPLLEKNPDKASTAPWYVPMVFSMARVIVLAFAFVMVRQVQRSGVAGWPEATLSIAVVLALPILNALEHARASQVIALARTIVERFGQGAARPMQSVFTVEPSAHDDHRDDESPYASDGELERVRHVKHVEHAERAA
jgi:hypothetical protein